MITGYNPNRQVGKKKMKNKDKGKRTKRMFLAYNNNYLNALEQGTEPPAAPAELLSGRQVSGVSVSL